MSVPISDKLNALIPLFDLNWWQLFAIFLIADWGIILAIKYFEPLGWKRAYWRSSIYGDIFLPIGIASAMIVTQQADLDDAWYATDWWNWLVFSMGWLIILGIELYLVHPKNGHYSLKQLATPSRIWHTLIFPFMFYFSVITIIPLFTTREPLWAFALALIGYGGWLSMYVLDLIRPPDFTRTH